jgi:hypothetical protein
MRNLLGLAQSFLDAPKPSNWDSIPPEGRIVLTSTWIESNYPDLEGLVSMAAAEGVTKILTVAEQVSQKIEKLR